MKDEAGVRVVQKARKRSKLLLCRGFHMSPKQRENEEDTRGCVCIDACRAQILPTHSPGVERVLFSAEPELRPSSGACVHLRQGCVCVLWVVVVVPVGLRSVR